MKNAVEPPGKEVFMRRAFELAQLGKGYVSPNPLVGAVIVNGGKIIGEGWHMQYGGPHAEVNAIADVRVKSLIPGSSMYVSLEPCSHFGKTPPCADMLIREGIKKVFISNIDPNPLVAGKGIRKLLDGGIEVESGLLEQDGRKVNARFLTFFEKKRPYIILKWAQTADGFIARENYDSKWISNEYSRKLVHKWRSEEDAILVGRQTALSDDPILNVRSWTGPNPIRIVIDRNLDLPKDLKLLADGNPTLCYNLQRSSKIGSVEFVKLGVNGFIRALVADLYGRHMQSVIIEGGAQTLEAFISEGLWDEARVFVSPTTFGNGIPAPTTGIKPASKERILDDELQIFYC